MKDLLLDNDGDLAFENNDFVFGESDQQHLALLLLTPKGAWKENPTASVGAMNYLESEDLAGLVREIRQRFIQDGAVINNIEISGSAIKSINATYPQ